jgi:hypothetical protein
MSRTPLDNDDNEKINLNEQMDDIQSNNLINTG